MRPLAFVRVNTKLGKPEPVTIRALLDSGASESLIDKKFVKNLRIRTSSKSSIVWSTPAGEMKTQQRVKTQFTIPELQEKKLIEWNLHVTASETGICQTVINFVGTTEKKHHFSPEGCWLPAYYRWCPTKFVRNPKRFVGNPKILAQTNKPNQGSKI